MAKDKNCLICQQKFTPNKYRQNQKVCSDKNCQFQRQFNNIKKWQANNKEHLRLYYKTNKERYREYHAEWRKNNIEHIKLYRENHKERHREYMKEYMRKRRKSVRKNEKRTNSNSYNPITSRKYYLKNKEKINEYQKEYNKMRREIKSDKSYENEM